MNVSLIKSKFLRSRPNLQLTRLWEQNDNVIKEDIAGSIKLSEDEVPIISYYPSNHYWWLLSNNALYVTEIGAVTKYDFKDLKAVEIPQISDNDEGQQLKIIHKGDIINLNIEISSWAVLYSIFKFVIAKQFRW